LRHGSRLYGSPKAIEVLIGVPLKIISNYLDDFNPAPLELDDPFKAQSSGVGF
jgi:hypothetical protein